MKRETKNRLPVTKFQITWREIQIEVKFTPDYCGRMHLIELMSEHQLPVTETGYRSEFRMGWEDIELEHLKKQVFWWIDREAEKHPIFKNELIKGDLIPKKQHIWEESAAMKKYRLKSRAAELKKNQLNLFD